MKLLKPLSMDNELTTAIDPQICPRNGRGLLTVLRQKFTV